jgi:hypothetical protein
MRVSLLGGKMGLWRDKPLVRGVAKHLETAHFSWVIIFAQDAL